MNSDKQANNFYSQVGWGSPENRLWGWFKTMCCVYISRLEKVGQREDMEIFKMFYMFKLILPTLDKIQMIFKELLVLTSEYI